VSSSDLSSAGKNYEKHHSTTHPVAQEECASNPDPASCTVDLEDRRFWRGALGPWGLGCVEV